MPARQFRLSGDGIPIDAFALAYEAHEALSEPFVATVRFSTRDPGFTLDEALRTSAALALEDDAGVPRYLHGIVAEARFVREVDRDRTFEVVLRPALSALAFRETCRLFQEKSLVQIVQSVFVDAGFGDDVDWRLTRDAEPRELVVQWRESHLAFVHRLLEELGICYFFEHGPKSHKLVLADDASAFGLPDTAIGAILSERTRGGRLPVPGADVAWDLERTRRVRTTAVQLRDYDFEKPETFPGAAQEAADAWPAPYYEYPARFVKGSEGESIATARLGELRRDADTLSGHTHATWLLVGAPFLVQQTVEPCHSGMFVVTHLASKGTQSADGGSAEGTLERTFRAIPEGHAWAPPRKTPKPRIFGVQTAVVTGSSKQEQALHVDKYGRIKVRFFWDRQSPEDHTSSCWIRVGQVGLGGSMVLPRVGWEVSVAFLEGDPDRPVVLGRVDNGAKVPPYALPSTKTSGSLKSMSSPGAGGHNEVLLADSGGSQGFSVHAQKDLNVTVRNDKDEEVAVDEERHTNTNVNTTIGANDTAQVGSDQSLTVGAVLSQKIGGNQTIQIGGNDVTNAISNLVEKITGSRAYTVGANQITIQNGIRYEVSGNLSRTVGAVELVATPSRVGDDIAGSLTETAGAVKIQASVGNVAEEIGGSRDVTSVAAELHLTKGGIKEEAGGAVTRLVGGLHYQKLAGDLVIKAPMVTLLGAVGKFKGGKSELKLGGGPVVLKGSKISVKSALVVKMSGSMKLGS